MTNLGFLSAFVLVFFISNCQRQHRKPKWEVLFEKKNIKGTFVLKKMTDPDVNIYNLSRSDSGYLPASTFKVLHSLIALQTSVVKSVEDTILWDGTDRGYKPWNKDHTMQSALPVSCVWFYQELARRIGNKRMLYWVSKVDYGNNKIGKRIDNFWLEGDMRISAREQVLFLEKLINNTLPFASNIQNTVKKIMISDSTANYVVHSKTGWTQKTGWYIGFVETRKGTWVFALNMDIHTRRDLKYRKFLTYQILQEEGIIP